MADVCRITLFTCEPLDFKKTEWWENVVGNEQDNREEIRREGKIIDSGSFYQDEYYTLYLSRENQRIDWVVKSSADDPSLSNIESCISLMDDVLPKFHSMITPWLDVCPAINRIAFGSVLLEVVTSRSSGYKKLNQYLHGIEIDAEKSKDFHYRINRPRAYNLGDEHIEINRLSTWGVIQRINLLHNKPDLFFTNLATDINTDAERKQPINTNVLPDLLKTLVNYSNEITEQGDLP